MIGDRTEVGAPVVGNVDLFRPRTLDDYIGQEGVKRTLGRRIAAARARGVPLPHVLLAGAPGYGKTSLARLIAAEMDEEFTEMTLPFETAVLRRLEGWRGVMLIDEVHSAPKAEHDELLTLLESGWLHSRRAKRTIRPDAITVIGATTEPERLPRPLRERFAIKPEFEEYTVSDLIEITKRKAAAVGHDLGDNYACAIARASGGLPREIKNIVSAYDAFDAATGRPPTLAELCADCQIAPDGLKPSHCEYLAALNSTPDGRLGLEGLRHVLSLPSNAAVLERERLLVQAGYVQRTPTGRMITGAGVRRLREADFDRPDTGRAAQIVPTLLAALEAAGPEGMSGSEQRDLFSRNLEGRRLALARAELERRNLARTTTVETGGRPRIVTKLVETTFLLPVFDLSRVRSFPSLPQSSVSSSPRGLRITASLSSDKRTVSDASS
jgi:Holliday junction DNA helicase RuvB